MADPSKRAGKVVKKMTQIKTVEKQRKRKKEQTTVQNGDLAKSEDDCVVIEPSVEVIELMEEQQVNIENVHSYPDKTVQNKAKLRGTASGNAKFKAQPLKSKSNTSLKKTNKFSGVESGGQGSSTRRSMRILAMAIK